MIIQMVQALIKLRVVCRVFPAAHRHLSPHFRQADPLPPDIRRPAAQQNTGGVTRKRLFVGPQAVAQDNGLNLRVHPCPPVGTVHAQKCADRQRCFLLLCMD